MVFFRGFLGLVACAGTSASSDGPPDDRTRRATDRSADDGASDRPGSSANSGARLVIAFGGLAGDGTGGAADHSASHRTGRARHGATNRAPGERAGPGAHGLGASFILVVETVIWFKDIVPASVVVASHSIVTWIH
jgi:hypothetical protein